LPAPFCFIEVLNMALFLLERGKLI